MTKREPETRYCFDVVSDLDYFAGDVVFPNGKKCKIFPNPTRIAHTNCGSNPFVYLLKIEKPCDACYQ